jgi:hypothetical protein
MVMFRAPTLIQRTTTKMKRMPANAPRPIVKRDDFAGVGAGASVLTSPESRVAVLPGLQTVASVFAGLETGVSGTIS